MAYTLAAGRINVHRVLGAVAVFLLIGIAFTQAHRLVAMQAPGAYLVLGVPADYRQIVTELNYYSFVTLPSADRLPVAGARETDIFITPGFDFRVVDQLVTNFHLPRSTLLMLVSAFAGFEHMQALYAHAISERYRFFSYGDAMLLDRYGCGSVPGRATSDTSQPSSAAG